MIHAVVFSDEAVTDLNDIYDYIAPRAGDRVALGYVQQIYRYCLGFDLFPERGISRDDLETGLRIVGFKRQLQWRSRSHSSQSRSSASSIKGVR